MQGNLRIENDRTRADIRTDEGVLLTNALVGDAGKIGKLGARQCRRHHHLAHRRRLDVRYVPFAVAADGDVQAVKPFGGFDIVRQANLQDFDRIDGGAAADRQN